MLEFFIFRFYYNEAWTDLRYRMAVLFIVSSASDGDIDSLAFFLLFKPLTAPKRIASSALPTSQGAQ